MTTIISNAKKLKSEAQKAMTDILYFEASEASNFLATTTQSENDMIPRLAKNIIKSLNAIIWHKVRSGMSGIDPRDSKLTTPELIQHIIEWSMTGDIDNHLSKQDLLNLATKLVSAPKFIAFCEVELANAKIGHEEHEEDSAKVMGCSPLGIHGPLYCSSDNNPNQFAILGYNEIFEKCAKDQSQLQANLNTTLVYTSENKNGHDLLVNSTDPKATINMLRTCVPGQTRANKDASNFFTPVALIGGSTLLLAACYLLNQSSSLLRQGRYIANNLRQGLNNGLCLFQTPKPNEIVKTERQPGLTVKLS